MIREGADAHREMFSVEKLTPFGVPSEVLVAERCRGMDCQRPRRRERPLFEFAPDLFVEESTIRFYGPRLQTRMAVVRFCDEQPLLPNPSTGRMWPHRALQRVWNQALEAAEMPHVTLYEGAKHTMATDRAP